MASLTAASSGTCHDGRNLAGGQFANKGFRHTGDTEHRVASISETQTFPNSPVEVVICRATKVAKMIHEAAKERIGQPLDGNEVSA